VILGKSAKIVMAHTVPIKGILALASLTVLVYMYLIVDFFQTVVKSECAYIPEPSAEDRRLCAPASSKYNCLKELGYEYECK